MSQNCLPSVGPNKDESPHPGLDQLANCHKVLDGERPDPSRVKDPIKGFGLTASADWQEPTWTEICLKGSLHD